MRTVELWTDGSGTTDGNPGGWAYVLRVQQSDGSWVEKRDQGGCSATTNNRMEVTAILMGLKALTVPCRVELHADSEYATNPIKLKWLGNWKNSGWRKPKKNVDLMKELDRLNGIHDIFVTWVKGHAGVELNEDCDQRAGAERRKILDAPDVWIAEPCGDRTAVQPALLDPDASSHLEEIAAAV